MWHISNARRSRLRSFEAVSVNIPVTDILIEDLYPCSAIAGLVRSYGQLILPAENITLNAICPHVVRTGISKHTPWFYDDLEKRGLLVDISRVIDGFEEFLGESTRSAECLEVGPKGSRVVPPEDYMDEETRLGVEATTVRSARLWMDGVE